MSMVLVCDELDGYIPRPPDVPDCAHVPYWVDVSSFTGGGSLLPPLGLEDAASIALAIAMVWVIGYAWRQIRRAFESID